MPEATMGTLVTYNPKAVTPDITLAELRSIMEQLQVRHIPVIDEQHHVVGIVSERDLARVKYDAATTAVDGSDLSIEHKRVEEIMARQVLTLEQHESPEIALRAMVVHAFHAVPVTDGGRLVGMITSSDFLREYSYGEWPGGDDVVRVRMGSSGSTVDSEAPLGQVLEAAEQHNQEFVVIVRRHRPLGILSRTALRVSLYEARINPEMAEVRSTPIRALLATLPSLPAEMSLSQAAGRMHECHARALPVVDRARMLLGVLEEDDLLKGMVERLNAGA